MTTPAPAPPTSPAPPRAEPRLPAARARGPWWFLGLCGMLLVYVLGITRDGSEQTYAAAALAIVSLAVLLYRALTRSIHWLEPGIVIGVCFFLYYANGAAFIHFNPERFAVRGDIDARLPRDLVLLQMGMVAWVLGYALPLGRAVALVSPRLGRVVHERRFWRAWAVAMGLSWAARFVAFFGWADSALVSSYRNLPQLLLPIGVMMWAASRARGNPEGRYPIRLLAGFAIELAWQLPTTMKGNLFYPFLLSILGFYLVRGVMPRRALTALLVALVLWIPVGLALRLYLWNDAPLSTRDALSVAVESSYDQGLGASLGETYRYMLHRSQMMDVFDVVVTNVPSRVEFKNGSTYTDIPLMLIPRAIWPEKPVFNYMKGEWGREIAGIDPEHEAVGMGFVAELYFNFGTRGILVGMLLFGIACRALWVWYRERNGASLAAGMLYLVLIKQLTALGAAATVFVGLIQFVLLYLVFYYAFSLPAGSPRVAGAWAARPPLPSRRYA